MESTLMIGSTTAIATISVYQESPTAVIVCSLDDIGRISAEFVTAKNPRSGCDWVVSDPMNNTSTFTPDNLYKEYGDKTIRYNQTQSAVEYFSRTFPNSNLSGEELAVASTTLHLLELGRGEFVVAINRGETRLLEFCQEEKWRYRLVG